MSHFKSKNNVPYKKKFQPNINPKDSSIHLLPILTNEPLTGMKTYTPNQVNNHSNLPFRILMGPQSFNSQPSPPYNYSPSPTNNNKS